MVNLQQARTPLRKRRSGHSAVQSSGSGKDIQLQAGAEEEEVEGMRVDFYLVVFLKFIASIVLTIEVDSTTSF